MGGMIRHLVSNPCRDACGTETTDAVHEGSPVLRCPGCASTWVDVTDGAASAPAIGDGITASGGS